MGIVAAVDMISAIFVFYDTRRRIIIITNTMCCLSVQNSARVTESSGARRVQTWATRGYGVGEGLSRGLLDKVEGGHVFFKTDSEGRASIATYRSRAWALRGVGSRQHTVRETLCDGVHVYQLDKSILT